MPRLPIPGSDDGNWGDILNDYLLQTHQADGSLRSTVVAEATIQDGAITAPKLADNAIVSTKLAPSAVTASAIASDAISTPKVANDAITEPKLAISNAPTSGYVLSWNGTALAWVAASSADPSLGGDLTGTASNAQIAAGAIVNADINASAAIAQSKIANLTTDLAGKAATSHTHAAGDITSGTIASARLGSGTANSTTYLRGDGTWATPAGGGFLWSPLIVTPTANQYFTNQFAYDFSASRDLWSNRDMPIIIPVDITVDRIGVNIITAFSSGTIISPHIYAADSEGRKGSLITTASPIAADSTGWKEAVLDEFLTAGLYWLSVGNSLPNSDPGKVATCRWSCIGGVNMNTDLTSLSMLGQPENSNVAVASWGPLLVLRRGGGFSPEQLPGLSLWLKADTITGLADGDSLSTWLDSSSNATHASQANNPSRPTYRTNQINGQPIVRFDGVDDFMTSAAPSGSPDQTLFAVLRLASIGGAQTIRGGADGDGARALQWLFQSGTPNINAQATANIASASTSITSGVPILASVVFSDTNNTYSFRLNTANNGSGTSTETLTSHTTMIGNRVWGNEYLNGDLAELIIYNTILDNTQIAQIETYLANKYGL